jgi:hypothetical protein
VRESKEKKKSSFFFWLCDFYLFFTISRKFKSIIKGIGKKGKFKSVCFAFPQYLPLLVAHVSSATAGSPDD